MVNRYDILQKIQNSKMVVISPENKIKYFQERKCDVACNLIDIERLRKQYANSYIFSVTDETILFYFLKDPIKYIISNNIKNNKLSFFILNLPYIYNKNHIININTPEGKVLDLYKMSKRTNQIIDFITQKGQFKKNVEKDITLVNSAYEYLIKHLPPNGDVFKYNKAIVDTFKLFPTDRGILNLYIVIQNYLKTEPVFKNNLQNAVAFMENNHKELYNIFKDFIIDINKITDNITVLPFNEIKMEGM